MRIFIGLLCWVCIAGSARGQEVIKDSSTLSPAVKKGITFTGLLQTRYNLSLTRKIDVNGLQYATGQPYVDNSFSLRRVRFNARGQVSRRFDLGILVNFAEFSQNALTGKVLENAFARFSLNDHFHIIAGQFRPYFGLEDAIQNDFVKSLDFSNGYYLFGRNGWQSFQTGLAVYGNLNRSGKMPLRYFAGVHNGNGRNQSADSDNGKHFYARFEAEPAKWLQLGFNAGIGTIQNEKGNAYGADLKHIFSLGSNWEIEVRAEYKEGNNFQAFEADSVLPSFKIKDLRMRDFFVNPIVRYKLNAQGWRSVEFSNRYEWVNENYRLGGNIHQVLTPMVSFEFAEDFNAVLQLGADLHRYKKQVPLTIENNRGLFITQLQLRF